MYKIHKEEKESGKTTPKSMIYSPSKTNWKSAGQNGEPYTRFYSQTKL